MGRLRELAERIQSEARRDPYLVDPFESPLELAAHVRSVPAGVGDHMVVAQEPGVDGRQDVRRLRKEKEYEKIALDAAQPRLRRGRRRYMIGFSRKALESRGDIAARPVE